MTAAPNNRYHVTGLDDLLYATQDELYADIKRAERDIEAAAAVDYFDSYEAAQEHEAYKAALERRLELTTREYNKTLGSSL